MVTEAPDSGGLSAAEGALLEPADAAWTVVAALLVGAAATAVAGGMLSGLLFKSSNVGSLARRLVLVGRAADIGTVLLVVVALVIVAERRLAATGIAIAAAMLATVIAALAVVQIAAVLSTPEFRAQVGSGALLASLGAPLATAMVAMAATAFAVSLVRR
jgi:hypothetical protein